MERGMTGNCHVPCGAGEKPEITIKRLPIANESRIASPYQSKKSRLGHFKKKNFYLSYINILVLGGRECF
jgi:hypothetical protein